MEGQDLKVEEGWTLLFGRLLAKVFTTFVGVSVEMGSKGKRRSKEPYRLRLEKRVTQTLATRHI